MKKLTEGKKMFWSVMAFFVIYAVIFIIFEDYDRKALFPFAEASDWHLLIFSLVVMVSLAVMLLRYARRMDERIHREKTEKQTLTRRELTQNISHELKTPVAGILGYTETLIDNPGMAPETRDLFIRRTHAQAQRLAALLQDIAALNRMDYAAAGLALERVDVAQLVAETIEETAPRLEGKHMKINNCLPQSIIVHGNRELIYSIFSNLIGNAINYAGDGTVVEIAAEREGRLWRFTFADNGVGIDPEHLDRIFERFYRVDKGRSRDLGGTGLGLAIVKNAVQLHGGTIKAEAPASGGLRLVFTLKGV